MGWGGGDNNDKNEISNAKGSFQHESFAGWAHHR
jgi:hypothetical protein